VAVYIEKALLRIEGLIKQYEEKNRVIDSNVATLKELDMKFLNKDKLQEAVLKLEGINKELDKSLVDKKRSNRRIDAKILRRSRFTVDPSSKGAFGIPTEKYGFSNNTEGFMGAPSFEKTKFTLYYDKIVRINIK
jgi:hypothetical protein